jgi:hypothetical protein
LNMKYLNALVGACWLLFVGAQADDRWHGKDNLSKPIPAALVCADCLEQTFTAYITGYSSADNDPPNSTAIWLDGKSGNAGGAGTYSDPITVAVAEGQYRYGTAFYLPHVKRYFKAADSCPPCKKGHQGLPWLDVYVGDASGPAVIKCQEKLTGIRAVIQNPKATYEARSGPIFDGICTI